MVRYRSELDIGRDLDGHYSKLFLRVAKRDFSLKIYVSMQEVSFNSLIYLNDILQYSYVSLKSFLVTFKAK